MKRNKDVFKCYSPQLRKHLDTNGTSWIGKGYNEKINKTYWIFERTLRFELLLGQYSKTLQQ